MQKAEHRVQTLSQGFILINIVETDRFPVLTGILPHVREPEARDVKGLKDHRSQRLAIPPCATFVRSEVNVVLGPHSLSIRVQH